MIVDLFSGAGGASTGVRAALGLPVTLAVDLDREARALHQANHPTTTFWLKDLAKVAPPPRAEVDVLWASPPCVGFSLAKADNPVDPKVIELPWVVARWAAALAPRLIIVENVDRIRHWGAVDKSGKVKPWTRGAAFYKWTERFRELGYDIEWRLLRACDFGAPTVRTRLYVVARRDGARPAWPEPTHGPGLGAPWRTVADCLDMTRPFSPVMYRAKPLAPKTLAILERAARELIDKPRLEGLGGAEAGDRRLFLLHYHGRRECSEEALRRPMRTVTTICDFGLALHEGGAWTGIRMLSPRELANAQGFPPDWSLEAMIDGKMMGRDSLNRCLGNSVPPPVAEALVRANAA